MLPQSRQQPFVCPECGSLEVIEDPKIDEISCVHCGLVLREAMIDRGPEWRAFTLEEKQKLRRTGPPTIYRSYDKMLSTTFRPYRDALGKRLPLKTRLVRVGEQDGEAVRLERVVDRDPQIPRRLHHRLHLIVEVGELRCELPYPFLTVLESYLVEDRCLTNLLMDVDSYILHRVSPLTGGLQAACPYRVSMDQSGSRSDSAQSS